LFLKLNRSSDTKVCPGPQYDRNGSNQNVSKPGDGKVRTTVSDCYRARFKIPGYDYDVALPTPSALRSFCFGHFAYYVQYLSSCASSLRRLLDIPDTSHPTDLACVMPTLNPPFPLCSNLGLPSTGLFFVIPLAIRSGLPSTPKQPHHPLTRPGKSLGRSFDDLGQRFFLLDPLGEPGEVRFACPGVDVDLQYPGSFSGRGWGIARVGQRRFDRLLEHRRGVGRVRGGTKEEGIVSG
jgi:hypothetical protein